MIDRDQYEKLTGNASKHGYVAAITREGRLHGTGIVLGSSFILSCEHVCSDWERPSQGYVLTLYGRIRAEIIAFDSERDLALLRSMDPIPPSSLKFNDESVQPGVSATAVGVQEKPGYSNELAIAELNLTCRNMSCSNGEILDIQFEGGARPGYSGGPVIVAHKGVTHCIGLMVLGGSQASNTFVIGLAYIRAFLAEHLTPDDAKQLTWGA